MTSTLPVFSRAVSCAGRIAGVVVLCLAALPALARGQSNEAEDTAAIVLHDTSGLNVLTGSKLPLPAQAELRSTLIGPGAKKTTEAALIGFAAGAVTGAVVSIIGDDSENAGVNVFLFALPGALLGALLATFW